MIIGKQFRETKENQDFCDSCMGECDINSEIHQRKTNYTIRGQFEGSFIRY